MMTMQLSRSLAHRSQSELSGWLQAASTTVPVNPANFNPKGSDSTPHGQPHQQTQGNSKLQQSEAMMTFLLQLGLEETVRSPSFPIHFPKHLQVWVCVCVSCRTGWETLTWVGREGGSISWHCCISAAFEIIKFNYLFKPIFENSNRRENLLY